MRPKVVIVTLLAAFALLAGIAVMRGLAGRHVRDGGGQASAPAQDSNSSPATNQQTAQLAASSGNPPVVSDEMRAALIEKETDQIQELAGEVDGTNDPIIIAALLQKVENPEAQVRQAALDALTHIDDMVQADDTNVVAGLRQVADRTTDLTAKVAIMETINYLNLPSAFPAVQPPETFSNTPVVLPRHLQMNPAFLHTNTMALRSQNGGQ